MRKTACAVDVVSVTLRTMYTAAAHHAAARPSVDWSVC
jgi:hypothetical protein